MIIEKGNLSTVHRTRNSRQKDEPTREREGDRGGDAEGEGLPTGELASRDTSQGEGDAPRSHASL